MMKRYVSRGVKIAMVALIGIPLFGEVVVQLWNWLMPALFNLHTIGFWQAIGLLVLSRIFFGGFRGGPRYRPGWRKAMTPEERERFREGVRACRPA